MLHKEIKTMATAKKVARELVNDLHSELDCFKSYVIIKKESSDSIEIQVRDNLESICHIITGCVIDDIMKVYNCYEFRYDQISCCLTCEGIYDEKNNNLCYVPIFEITISVKHESPVSTNEK